MAVSALLPPSATPALAGPGDRTLTFYYTHTKETGTFTFKRNGQYDQAVLAKMNYFLRDWRRNEPAKMDPALFDLLWQVYQEAGAKQPINIVSAYRSPKTNNMLRSKSSGVAENSQHMKGHAMDFFIPGVPLNRLREVAMRHQVGGVGYYPTSGSPFVHLDTGSVRAWPRMTRAQLKQVFPDGKTLHLPTDGKPLSDHGRAYAMAEWQKCRMVPCSGNATAANIMLASNDRVEPPIPAKPSKSLMDVIFGVEAEEKDDMDEVMAVAALDPAQRAVKTIDIAAPVPAMRAAMREALVAKPEIVAGLVAPVPARKSSAMMLATRAPMPGETAVTALAALGGGARPQAAAADSGLMTAYVPTIIEDPGAQLALRMIIERETTASLRQSVPPGPPVLNAGAVRTASLAGGSADAFKGMFDMTWNAVSSVGASSQVAEALQALVAKRRPIASLEARRFDLVSPELDHVDETLVHPVPFSGSHFAELYQAEGYLDKTTELGPLSDRMGFMPESTALPVSDRFVSNTPLFLSTH